MIKKSKIIIFGWSLVAVVILVLAASSSTRLFHNFTAVATQDAFDMRYLEHPIVTTIHMITGILFILFAPLQLSKRFRSKNIRLHRRLGRCLLVCALISGLYGMVSSIVLPAFGGLASVTSGWFFGPLFMGSIIRSYWCITHKNVTAHREWMIRAFAIGLGVGTQRILLIMFAVFTGNDFTESFGPALWLGFSINLLIAETWINLTRHKISASSNSTLS